MNRVILTLIFSLIFPISLVGDEINFDVLEMVPKNIQKILDENKTKAQIIESFGKPDLEKEDQFFYEIDKYRFRLIINFENEKVKQVRYVTLDGVSVENLIISGLLSVDDLTPYPESGHHFGQYLKAPIENEHGQWEFFFQNNQRKQLHSFVWKAKK